MLGSPLVLEPVWGNALLQPCRTCNTYGLPFHGHVSFPWSYLVASSEGQEEGAPHAFVPPSRRQDPNQWSMHCEAPTPVRSTWPRFTCMCETLPGLGDPKGGAKGICRLCHPWQSLPSAAATRIPDSASSLPASATEKLGLCPLGWQQDVPSSRCYCFSDASCPGSEKCCNMGAMRICVQPVLGMWAPAWEGHVLEPGRAGCWGSPMFDMGENACPSFSGHPSIGFMSSNGGPCFMSPLLVSGAGVC